MRKHCKYSLVTSALYAIPYYAVLYMQSVREPSPTLQPRQGTLIQKSTKPHGSYVAR